MTLDPWGAGDPGVVPIVTNPSPRYVRERAQNASSMFKTLGMVENSQLVFFSLAPCGKKAATSRSGRASGPSFLNIGEARDSSIVVARLPECWT